MTKTPNSSLEGESRLELDQNEIKSGINRKNNYKNQKPILEKRRRDRINNSLDELKSLLLAIKQRDPLRYARLEKADILEMVVKHLKDIKKRRQAMVVAMEPILFRNFKMGYMDCTKATIDFINEIESPENTKKQQIIEHVTQQCMRTFQDQSPTLNFKKHFHAADESFSLLSSTFDREMEWPSLEERLGFSPIGKSLFLLPEISPLPGLLATPLIKTDEPRVSAFNVVNSFLCAAESASTSSSTLARVDKNPRESILIEDDTEDDDKLIIDDPNNNQLAWRPWL